MEEPSTETKTIPSWSDIPVLGRTSPRSRKIGPSRWLDVGLWTLVFRDDKRVVQEVGEGRNDAQRITFARRSVSHFS